MESKSAEDPVKDVPEAAAADVEPAVNEEEVSPLEAKSTADDNESAAGDSATDVTTIANVEESEDKSLKSSEDKNPTSSEEKNQTSSEEQNPSSPEEKDRRPSSEEKKTDDETGAGEETKTEEASKVESPADEPRLEDEPEEKFEDAVDSEEKLQEEEAATKSLKDSVSDASLISMPSSSALKSSSSSEHLPSLVVTESYEIEDSPEKPPNKPATPKRPVTKIPPLPSSVASIARQLSTIKSSEIETVELDDDDDDEEEDEYDDEEVATAAAVRDIYDDEEDGFEEDDEDDYYEDPESDDQDVSQVIQDAMDEINAVDDPESGEDDKMDVSSDEDDYSEDDDQPSVVVPKSVLSGKRNRDDDNSEEGEIYDNDEDIDEPEEDEDDDDDEDVEEVIELDRRKFSVSMGQISVEDESDEDVVPQQKKKFLRVKYKSYRQKVMAKIRRRTYKLLNRRSMHVMEEGSDALVCSDATKIVSLKSAVSSVGAKITTAAEEVSIKDPKSKEDQTITPGEVERKDRSEEEEAVVASGDATKAVSECKKDDENKENMTVKDNSKEVPRRVEVDEKAKVKDEEKVETKDRKQGKSEEDELTEDVMDSIDDIVADAKKQNGSKSEFNEELTFQMDVEESEKDYEEDEDEHEEDEEDEDDEEEEEGAVDLSSSYDANRSDRQTDDSDAIEMIDSSPEKDSSVVGIKPTRKLEPLQLDKSPSNSRKGSPEKVTVVKQEVEDDSEQIQESTKEAIVSASKSSPSRGEKQSEKPRETEAVSRKRRRSVDPDDRDEDDEPLVPSKKLKRELECNYPTHDRLLKEYIETTSNHSVGDIQTHTDALMVEIQTLNEMIRAKEIEWNNMIHLKKVKEEILLRLTRKKHVMDVMQTKLGEVSEYTHFDSSNLTNVRSASVGPRPPTPPPEVDIRPASVTPLHSSTLNTSKNANVSTNLISGSRQLPGSKDNSLFAQFNHSNSSVTMVPLSTSSSSLITSTNTILQSRANMKSSEVAKERPNAAQIQRQILPKPILSNHQQILNNLAMSAGLTAAGAPSTTGATSISTSSTTASVASAANILAGLSNNILAHTAALLNGHHHPSGSNHLTQSQVNQLQVGRQGVIKDVKSIIADYRQKHPEQVPRRGRRLKNIPSSGYEGITITNKSGSSRMPELGFLLGENSRPSSNDSSQSNSNNHLSTVAGGGALSTSPTSAGFSINDVLAQFAKMSQSDRNLLSNLGAAAAAAAAAAASAVSSNATATSSTTTHSSSSSRQQQQSQQNSAAANLSKNSYPEVTLHPVVNSNSGAGSNADMNHSSGSNASAANQSQNNSNANNSTNSLLHGILTKSSSRPTATGFTSFSPTLARLLTAPERMNSQAATVTSGALANLQANTGLNLSKSNSEITITPVVASNLHQSIMAHQQQLQEQQKQLQRLREQHFMNMDDEADDSVDRLVIDEGDDHHGTANNSRNDGHRESSSGVVITTRGGNGPEFHENDVPECQGCKKREAQFVCAGCGNQWYCSRECQVNAWDDHSEVCTG